MLTVKQRDELLVLVNNLRTAAFESARVMYASLNPDPRKLRDTQEAETATVVVLARWLGDHTDDSTRSYSGSGVA